MKDPKKPYDILPEQIVEDIQDDMIVEPEDLLLREAKDGHELLEENDLGMENLENDSPWVDVMEDNRNSEN